VHTAECLLPTLDAVLREAGVALEAVDAFAVTLGPGSFTGLRIGLATLKGFALGTARPAVGISSLAALAAAAPAGAGPVLATLDARRGELYAGAFADPGVRVADVLPEGLFAPEQLAGRFGACRVVGEGAQVCGSSARATPGPTRATWRGSRGRRSARARGAIRPRSRLAMSGAPRPRWCGPERRPSPALRFDMPEIVA
jgi:tRNA threonylcarbamoyl adenosine modification protein YeaZ